MSEYKEDIDREDIGYREVLKGIDVEKVAKEQRLIMDLLTDVELAAIEHFLMYIRANQSPQERGNEYHFTQGDVLCGALFSAMDGDESRKKLFHDIYRYKKVRSERFK